MTARKHVGQLDHCDPYLRSRRCEMAFAAGVEPVEPGAAVSPRCVVQRMNTDIRLSRHCLMLVP